jgi:hypothetical protein
MLKKFFTPPEGTYSIADIKLPKAFKAELNNNRISIKSPEKLCIYEDQWSYITYQFLDYIHKVIFEYKISLTVDFSDLKNLSAAASLLVFARITKCQICIHEPSAIKVIPPEDKEARKMFTQSGLWAGVKSGGISKVRKLIDSNNQYMSGSNAPIENYSKVLVATILNLINQGVKFNTQAVHTFTRGVQEAILNVDYHAYDNAPLSKQFEELGDSRWWQCSWLDKINNQLVFIIYDDGTGIVNSLKEQFPTLSDSEVLEKAMTIGVTKTLEPSRGKGSGNIIKTSCEFPNSHLVIMSGVGYYLHDENGVTLKELPFNLHGTIVQWVLHYTEENLK